MTILSEKIKRRASELGFAKTGIAKSTRLEPEKLDDWLQRGYHGTMEWMQSRRDVRLDPETLVPNARSVIVCAMNYYTPYKNSVSPEKGRVSRYAWGDDYHEVLRSRLKELLSFIRAHHPEANGRVFVDSAPVMEKVWAVRAGLGWQGKNSNLLTTDLGSWIFLGEVIVDIELEADEPFTADYCGNCTRCMDACPTGAIVRPGVVDARKCISYLTIELKADHDIPHDLADKMDNHIFGCDVCQEVCPWNHRKVKVSSEPAFQPRPHNLSPDLKELVKLTDDQFKKNYRRSPIKRAKREGLLRNVRIAFENKKK